MEREMLNTHKNGLFLCKVKGLKFCDYTVLKYDDNEWWQYVRLPKDGVEGWIGIKDDLKVIKIIECIE